MKGQLSPSWAWLPNSMPDTSTIAAASKKKKFMQ